MDKWRPEGWFNPYKMAAVLPIPIFKTPHSIFEAGADAMLQTLKQESAIRAFMTPEQMKLLAPEGQYPYGYLVFIPDSGEKEGII